MQHTNEKNRRRPREPIRLNDIPQQTSHRRTCKGEKNTENGRTDQRHQNEYKTDTTAANESERTPHVPSIQKRKTTASRTTRNARKATNGALYGTKHDDPLTQIGMQLATSGLKMDCALLVEVGDATLQDRPQDRMALGGNKTRSDKRKQNGKKLET